MGNQWYQSVDDDDDDDDEGQGQQQAPKALRSHATKLEKENRALKEQNDKLQKQFRQTAISQVLKDKGLDAKVAKLVPSDVEPTEEAVEKWLADYADIFPTKKTEETPATEGQTSSGAEGSEDEVDEDEVAQMGLIGSVTNAAQAPTRQQDLLKQLQSKDLKPEALMQMIQAAGGGYGVG